MGCWERGWADGAMPGLWAFAAQAGGACTSWNALAALGLRAAGTAPSAKFTQEKKRRGRARSHLRVKAPQTLECLLPEHDTRGGDIICTVPVEQVDGHAFFSKPSLAAPS